MTTRRTLNGINAWFGYGISKLIMWPLRSLGLAALVGSVVQIIENKATYQREWDENCDTIIRMSQTTPAAVKRCQWLRDEISVTYMERITSDIE